MNNTMKTWLMAAAGVAVGAVGTIVIGTGTEGTASRTGAKEPLYWVAPMDPNYRRDNPGKSPMGMDLVPVYEEGPQEPGTVQISPDVINNLGVRTAQVETVALNPVVKTVGYVQYDEDQLVSVDPRVEGWIEMLHVEAEGDQVAKGEPLYTLYSPTLVNAQEELVLALKQGDQRLVEGAVERLKALRVPESVIQQIKKTRVVLQNVTINSPQDGFVEKLNVRGGAYVTPGSRIMSIAVLGSVWVVGEIFERQLPFVELGDPVTLKVDYFPGRQWEGEVDYVYPTVDPATRTAQVRTRFSNAGHALKPGMFGQLTISREEGEPVLAIPREALIRTGDTSRVVLAQGDGKFKSINVSVGRIVDRQVEVLAGLKEGERVVTSAQFLIDSESSKTSDFMRMDHEDDAEGRAATVWATAKVLDVMADHRMVTLHHEPIDQWQWPAMTMDFTVADTVDLGQLEEGLTLHAEITRLADGGHELTSIHIPEGGSPSLQPGAEGAAEEAEEVNHSQHQNMDHGAMPSMDHSQHQGMSEDSANGGMSHD